jgi:hypothetical protein
VCTLICGLIEKNRVTEQPVVNSILQKPQDVTGPIEQRLCSKVRLPGRSHTADPRPSSHTHGCCNFPSQPGSDPPATRVTDLPDDHLRICPPRQGRRSCNPGSLWPLSLSPSHGPSGILWRNSKSAPQRQKSSSSGNLWLETGGGRIAPAQKKPGRAALLMLLVTGQDETTLPTSLCADLTSQGKLRFPWV